MLFTDFITLFFKSNKVVLGAICSWLYIEIHLSVSLIMSSLTYWKFIFLGSQHLQLLVKTFLLFFKAYNSKITYDHVKMMLISKRRISTIRYTTRNIWSNHIQQKFFKSHWKKLNNKRFIKNADLQFYSLSLNNIHQHLICFYLLILNLDFKRHDTLFKLITIISSS